MLGAPAWAVDGVIEINQTCATNSAEGCFSGDLPGFPVTINEPGSYRLTSDLIVASGVAILSPLGTSPDNVSIDLNGFRIDGTSSTSNGIQISEGNNWEIRNGTLEGFNSAVQQQAVSNGHRMIDLRVIGSSNTGISVASGEGHLMKDCSVTGSGGTQAAFIGARSVVIGNVFTGNSGNGLRMQSGAGYANNVIGNNGGTVVGGVEMGTNICDGTTTCP
jgi:hypothetical protein